MTKSKASADDKYDVAKMTISLYDRGENIGGKGENAGYKHSSIVSFPHSVFQSLLFEGC